MGISIADLLLSIHWFVTALFSHRSPLGYSMDRYPADTTMFCFINSLVSTSGGLFLVLYNFSFCIYIIQLIRNTLKQSMILKQTFHVFNFTVVLTVIIYYIVTD